MKKAFFFFALIFFISQQSTAQINTNTPWIWLKGANQIATTGSYGTVGVEAASNEPHSRTDGATHVDLEGNLWLFGGWTYLPAPMWWYFNDLWKYNSATNNWTWMKGSAGTNESGNYGVLGTPAAANTPGARGETATWTDASGNLWVFGGYGYDAYGNAGVLNDLWMYNVATNTWVWKHGSDIRNNSGSYGEQGTPSASNQPAARAASAAWNDAQGNMWLYGGYNGAYYELSDLWKYSPSTNQWTWMKGSAFPLAEGPVYGSLGVASPGNTPGTRYGSTAWTSNSGEFYLFGGTVFTSTFSIQYNDLWKYSPTANQWTWVNGANIPDQTSVPGTQGVPDAANQPGARRYASPFKDGLGNLWLFGGYGLTGPGFPEAVLNDLWKYSPTTNQWVWVKGGEYNAAGNYGTIGVPAVTNKPGGRLKAMSWSSLSGDFFLFGGWGNDANGGAEAEMNDLWKINSLVLLPAKLLSFTGKYAQQQAILEWKVTDHATTAAFVIERSYDGRRFDSVGIVASLAQQQNYSFSETLINPPVSQFFYRLKMMEQNGRHAYSKVVVLTTRSISLVITPNPASTDISITLSKDANEATAYDIIDQAGRVVSTGKFIRRRLGNTVSLNISSLPQGSYRLRVFFDTGMQQGQFTKL